MAAAKKEQIKNLSKEEQALADKAVLDANDTEKKHKDVILMNVDELKRHRDVLNTEIGSLSIQYESKKRILDGLAGSIAGAQSEIVNLNTTFQKKNKEMLDEITKKLSEIEASDKLLQAAIRENADTKKVNDVETSRLAEYRQKCNAELYEMKKCLDQNQSEWGKREADILRREAELKDAVAKFEEEKASLAPETDKISAIKNENILLLQKIEMDRVDIENMRRASVSERERLEQDKLIGQARIKQLEDKLANEEARLRKWEQDIKDYDLEVRAKSAEADKVLRRQQLQKEVDSAKK